MLTGEALTNTLVDELNDLGLPNMAATLDSLYRSERFLNLDHLSLIAELIEPEYQDNADCLLKRSAVPYSAVTPCHN